MNNLSQKLLTTSVLNAFAALINFLSNYLIVRFLSIEVFGSFSVFSSFIAFGGLIYILIPPNYSIFKIQDDIEFEFHLIRFFTLSSFAFLFFSVATHFLLFTQISIPAIFFYGISTYLLNFFDIKYQASDQLPKYFRMLLYIAVLKIILVILFHYTFLLNSLTDLLVTITIAQLIVIIVYFPKNFNSKKPLFFSISGYKNTFVFIRQNINTFSPYYLNTILKRIRENSIVLIFSTVINNQTLGLFALFTKVDSFVLGLSRNIESTFMNRNNIKIHKKDFYSFAIYFAILLQILYITVGIVYMKVISNEYFLFEIILQSLLVYPHVYFLLARAELLSKYNNKESNFSELVYIIIVLISFLITKSLSLNSIYVLLASYIAAKLGLQIFMIFRNRQKHDH